MDTNPTNNTSSQSLFSRVRSLFGWGASDDLSLNSDALIRDAFAAGAVTEATTTMQDPATGNPRNVRVMAFKVEDEQQLNSMYQAFAEKGIMTAWMKEGNQLYLVADPSSDLQLRSAVVQTRVEMLNEQLTGAGMSASYHPENGMIAISAPTNVSSASLKAVGITTDDPTPVSIHDSNLGDRNIYFVRPSDLLQAPYESVAAPAITRSAPSLTAQDDSPDLSGFVIKNKVDSRSVFELWNPETNETIFLKFTKNYEINRTEQASQLQPPPDAEVHLPQMVNSSQFATLNPEVRQTIAQWLDSDEGKARSSQGDTQILMTRGVPNDATLIGDPEILRNALRGQPITEEEWKRAVHEFEGFNNAGLNNNDVKTNTFLERDTQGKLNWYVIDYDMTNTFHGNLIHVDPVHLLNEAQYLAQDGLLDSRAVAWSQDRLQKYEALQAVHDKGVFSDLATSRFSETQQTDLINAIQNHNEELLHVEGDGRARLNISTVYNQKLQQRLQALGQYDSATNTVLLDQENSAKFITSYNAYQNDLQQTHPVPPELLDGPSTALTQDAGVQRGIMGDNSSSPRRPRFPAPATMDGIDPYAPGDYAPPQPAPAPNPQQPHSVTPELLNEPGSALTQGAGVQPAVPRTSGVDLPIQVVDENGKTVSFDMLTPQEQYRAREVAVSVVQEEQRMGIHVDAVIIDKSSHMAGSPFAASNSKSGEAQLSISIDALRAEDFNAEVNAVAERHELRHLKFGDQDAQNKIQLSAQLSQKLAILSEMMENDPARAQEYVKKNWGSNEAFETFLQQTNESLSHAMETLYSSNPALKNKTPEQLADYFSQHPEAEEQFKNALRAIPEEKMRAELLALGDLPPGNGGLPMLSDTDAKAMERINETYLEGQQENASKLQNAVSKFKKTNEYLANEAALQASPDPARALEILRTTLGDGSDAYPSYENQMARAERVVNAIRTAAQSESGVAEAAPKSDEKPQTPVTEATSGAAANPDSSAPGQVRRPGFPAPATMDGIDPYAPGDYAPPQPVPNPSQPNPATNINGKVVSIDQGPGYTRADTPPQTPVNDPGQQAPSAPVSEGNAPPGAGVTGAAAATSGLQMGTGLFSMYRNAEDMQEHGVTAKNAVGMALGAANTTAGGMSGLEAVAPGTLREGAAAGLEKVAFPLMGIMAAYDIATAAPGKTGEAAYREVVTNTAAGLFMPGMAAELTASGILLPVGAAIAAGIAVERDIDLTNIRKDNETALSSITADRGLAHLRAFAEGLHKDEVLAVQGDALAKDKDGRIALSQENMDAIRANTPSWEQDAVKSAAAEHLKVLDAQIRDDQMRDTRSPGSNDALQMLMQKEYWTHYEENYYKQKLVDIELSRQTTRELGDSDKVLLTGPDGKVLFTPENLAIIQGALVKDHGIAQAKETDSERVSNYWDLADGKSALIENTKAQQRIKFDDTISQELHMFDSARYTNGAQDRTPMQMHDDAVNAMRSGMEPTRNIYTLPSGASVYDAVPGDAQNGGTAQPPMPAALIEAYKADPDHNHIYYDVLYKKDDKGQLIYDKDGKPEIGEIRAFELRVPGDTHQSSPNDLTAREQYSAYGATWKSDLHDQFTQALDAYKGDHSQAAEKQLVEAYQKYAGYLEYVKENAASLGVDAKGLQEINQSAAGAMKDQFQALGHVYQDRLQAQFEAATHDNPRNSQLATDNLVEFYERYVKLLKYEKENAAALGLNEKDVTAINTAMGDALKNFNGAYDSVPQTQTAQMPPPSPPAVSQQPAASQAR